MCNLTTATCNQADFCVWSLHTSWQQTPEMQTGNGGKVRTLHGSGACSTQDIFFTCSYKYSSYAQYFQLFPYMSKTTQIIITTCNILQKSRLYIFGLNPILQKMKCNAGYLRQHCLIRRQCWTNMQIVCPQIHKILPLLDSFWSKP